MLRPELDWEVCQSCDPCAARAVCRPRAILKLGEDEPVYIEYSRCNSCGLCVLHCTYGAIAMKNNSASALSRDGCLPFR